MPVAKRQTIPAIENVSGGPGDAAACPIADLDPSAYVAKLFND